MGLPLWSSGYDSMLPVQEVWVRFLVRKLRPHIPCSTAQRFPKKKKKIKRLLFIKDFNVRHLV